ncbi:speckle-type POZ protein B-like [Parasteatoda tepidariorum]|uniref:speckle-type POZ protein B-like n=1 Tax=Parasteatoda tepidariorum TaxID=114398 RepID=UPI0039BD6486
MPTKEGCKYKFIWKIENFSHCFQKTGEEIESPMFTVEHLSKCKWALEVFPKGKRESSSQSLSLRLKIKEPEDGLETITIGFSFEILDAYGVALSNSISRQRVTFNQRGPRSGVICQNFFSLDKLEDEMKSWTNDTLTLQCCINGQAIQSTNFETGCEVRTQIGMDRCEFKWDIKTPQFLPLSESIRFTLPNVAQFEISLNDPDEYIEISLRCLERGNSLSRPVTFRMIFLNQDGIEICSRKESYSFKCTDNENWNFPSFVTKEQVKSKTNGVVHYDFSLICVASVPNGTVTSKIERYFYRSVHPVEKMVAENSPSVLQNDFRGLFVSKKYSDIKLRVDNDVFLAHRSVLAARSPVFTAMFDQEMSEAKTGIVDIVDIDGKTLNLFLEYLYTESISAMDYEIAKLLLVVADKYQVQSLKDECLSFLKSTISVENVCEVVNIASMVNEDMLKRTAINYVKTNAPKILTSPDWLNWIREHSDLASEILSELSLALGNA